MLIAGAAGIVPTNWAYETGSWVLETLVVVVLMAVSFCWLWLSFVRGEIKRQLQFGRFAPTMGASALAMLAVVSFTSLTGMLVDQGIVGVSPEPAHDEVLGVTFGFYLWQLAHTLPLVDAPGNLHWDKLFEFDDGLGGLLVIAFTGFVIFPLIQLARLILARGEVPFDVSVFRALIKHVGLENISVVRDRKDYGRAIVDKTVTVDVMRDVRNPDAVVGRLWRLDARPRRPDGYLLVVDAIAESVRERIELALSQAPFEAGLAVWRGDQPAEELTAALDALRERIRAASRTA